MKKKRIFAIAILIVALMATLAVPAYAGPPESGGGRWMYYPIPMDEKDVGCNAFVTSFEKAKWTGLFNGNSTENGKVVFHCNGDASFNSIVTFDAVSVNGKTGSLELSVAGQFPANATEWTGTWVIIRGTEELKNLHGQGAWWGEGAPDWYTWGYVDYAGNYHFDPN
jgi:hypothetical protein